MPTVSIFSSASNDSNTSQLVTAALPTPTITPQKTHCIFPEPQERPKTTKNTAPNSQESGRDLTLMILHARSIDTDCDGVSDAYDNCTDTPNKDQVDSDDDILGDACDALSTNVSVQIRSSHKQVTVGGEIIYTITVTNHGPVEESGSITIVDHFPTELWVDSVTTTLGECDEFEGSVRCSEIERLGIGKSLTIRVKTTALKAGRVVNTVIVRNGNGDLKRKNNKAVTVNRVVETIAQRRKGKSN